MNDWDAIFIKSQIDHLNYLAILEHNSGRSVAAEKLMNQACELAEQAEDLDTLVSVRENLEGIQRANGKHKEALAILAWLIGIATDPASSGRVKEERSLRALAGSFASFSDSARQMPGANLDDLLRVLREGELWMTRFGKPEWTADLRVQRGIILGTQGDKQAARREMEASLAIKRRQQVVLGFTFETVLLKLASLLIQEPFREFEAAFKLTEEVFDRPDTSYGGLLETFNVRLFGRQQMGDLEGMEQEAREIVELSRQSDRPGDLAKALTQLGRALAKQKRLGESTATFREALALMSEEDEEFPSVANSFAWNMYLAESELEAAASLAQRGWEKDKDNTMVLQTLAAILVRLDRWDEAAGLVREWASRVDHDYLGNQWHHDLFLFLDALKYGHAEVLAGMLDRDVWEPMRLALPMAARGENDLSAIPERLRNAVASLLAPTPRPRCPFSLPGVR